MIRALFFLLLFVCSSAFAHATVKDTARKDSVSYVTLDTMEITAPAGSTPYQPSAPRVWEIKNIRIALTFDLLQKTAGVREWIIMQPYYFQVDTVELDAKGVKLDSVMLVGTKGKLQLNYVYENDKLKIFFNQLYKPGENAEIYLKYTAMPYANQSGGSGAIRDDRGLYFINTDHAVPHKPAQIWTQGETESNSHWMITIDKPNSRFTTQIELTVPDSFVTLSNGALVKKSPVVKGLRTDFWKMDMPIQAYAVMFAIGKFRTDVNHWRNKEVSYYVEPEFEHYAYLMFNHTREMMEFFSQRTGVPYPWNKYSQIVVRDYVSGAMENTSATLFGEFMNQNPREVADRNSEDVVAHELFHQWFGDYVTCESWSNITVNESFANYGEQLWRRFRYGNESADELAFNDLMGYLRYSNINDPQLVRFNYDSREDVFDPISYNKGGAVLRYLNSLTGDSAFNKAMNIYLTKNALHSAEAHNWRMAVEEATGQDWNWFFNEWYYHAGHPVLKCSYTNNDSLQVTTVTVTQAQSDSGFVYRLPLKAAVFYGTQKTVVNWDISKKSQSFKVPYKNGVKPVVVPDYTHVLPGELKDGKTLEDFKAQFVNTDDYVSKRFAVNAAGRHLAEPVAQAIMDLAFADNLHSIRRYALSQVRNTSNESYRTRWADYIISMAKYDSDKLVRTEAFEILGEWKINGARGLMIQGVHYSSYSIAGAALEALYKIDSQAGYQLAKEMVSTDPKANLLNAVWSVIGKRAADEDAQLFAKYVPYIFGNKRYYLASAMHNYLKKVNGDEPFRVCCNVLVDLINTEELRTYRAAFNSILFSLADGLNSNLKSEQQDVSASAKGRLAIIKPLLQKVIAAETDADILKDSNKKMKALFEKQ